MIAALFVDPKGPYSSFCGLDLWDEKRDARKYSGPYPVIAHPPCNRWGKLAPVNYKRWGTPIGEDGGCFESALNSVRTYGGVLEHPANTIAWKTFGLVKPTEPGWMKVSDNEWVGEVWQSAYGHPATKRTWLLYVGDSPKEFSLERIKGKYQIGGGVNTGFNKKPRLAQSKTHLTPPLFAKYLIDLVKKDWINHE